MPAHKLSVASVLAHHEAFYKSPGTSSNTSVSSVSSNYSPAGNIRRTHERLQRPRVEQERTWNSKNTSQFSSGDSASWCLHVDAGAHRCAGLFSDLKPLRKRRSGTFKGFGPTMPLALALMLQTVRGGILVGVTCGCAFIIYEAKSLFSECACACASPD